MSKNKNSKELLSWKEAWQLNKRALILLYRQYPKLILMRIINTIWRALTPYVGISLSARIVEELAAGRDPERLKRLVLATLLSAALIASVSALINTLQNIYSAGRMFKMRFLMCQKMLDMDYVIMDDPKIHQRVSTINQNQNGGGWGFNRVLGNFESLLNSIFSLLGGSILIVTLFTSRVPVGAKSISLLNSPLFLALLIAVLLAAACLAPALSTRANRYYALNSDKHRLANRLFSYWGWLGRRTSLALDMRIYRQDQLCDKYNWDKTTTFGSNGYFAKLARGGPIGLYSGASSAVSSIFTGIVYLFVCIKAWAGAFGIGMVTQYISSISRFSGSIGALFGTAGDMRNNASFLKMTLEFLDIPNIMYQGSLTIEKRSDRQYEVEFRDVSFRYPGSEDYALRHVNMKFKVGQRLAVVGENGSGKTTFIKLLCRLYDPTEGVILLNGIDIRKYDYQEYISVFSVVFQDFALTSFPLGQNIGTKTDFDRMLAESSLEKAGFGNRLKELDAGLDTYLTKALSKEGVEMSGGEKQKIAIARALYKDSPFIVLDEPTAALDPLAEAEIYGRLNEIIEDKTAIYISHRLSSCRFCDDILVFHKGSVIQQGSHDVLVCDEQGKYHELWHAQAQYYKEDAQAQG